MPITQIPPAPPDHRTPREPSGDLYDAERWESAYRDMHEVPALLIQLQDDLSRSRKREAFWISVVVHMVVIILVVNAQRFERFFPRRPVLAISPDDLLRQKDLTYLEMPPDQQKAAKRPDTDKISDKNRIATSKTPQLNREDLQKILENGRRGAPGASAPPAEQQPAAPAMAQTPPAAQPPQPPQNAPPQTNQVAKLQPPPKLSPKAVFGDNSMSAGSAIAQATRAAAANRGAGYSGEGGDYGLGQGRQGTEVLGPLETLSDTMGVDFGPYLSRVLHDVRENWYRLIPEAARAPLMKKGKVSIEFAIMKDGRVQGMQIVNGSGDVALDRAAYGGITASNPFPPLPNEFGGQYLALRFSFFYNPDKSELQ